MYKPTPPISSRTPIEIRLAVLARRIKKADDVARLLDEPKGQILRAKLKDAARFVESLQGERP